MGSPADDPIAAFRSERPRLLRIAYRMLGSMTEAEDVVQDAYLRWHRTDRAAVRDPGAFLTRTVTRLCLDVLKSARARRETYVGPWLPEPIVRGEPDHAEDDLTLTLMLALERLSPLERAAFLLHDVFDVPFQQIAQSLDRDPAACRQLARRARRHVHEARPRFPVSEERGRDLADAFFAASRGGDLAALQDLLASDVVLYSDGGGKALAARRPIVGASKVARFFAGLARKAGRRRESLLHRGKIDGLPGFVTVDPLGVLQTTALSLDGDRIRTIYVVRNPDKLRHIRRDTADR